MRKNETDFESSIFFEAQKYYFVFDSRLNFSSNFHIRNVVLALPNGNQSRENQELLARKRGKLDCLAL